MTDETRLLLINQMITNNLLSIIANNDLANRSSIHANSAKLMDNLDVAVDDMVKAVNKFKKLDK